MMLGSLAYPVDSVTPGGITSYVKITKLPEIGFSIFQFHFLR